MILLRLKWSFLLFHQNLTPLAKPLSHVAVFISRRIIHQLLLKSTCPRPPRPRLEEENGLLPIVSRVVKKNTISMDRRIYWQTLKTQQFTSIELL
ncbi:hypothetical protein TNIN_432301 [Trichonephila inaurata madagascariensis]|uniref:Uncharacterized protein n=1 Tax=Trichonephila inaurata madagascariensis TaxID=2747483 RepID=A0A8X6XSH4_9ARAC|nr:hypothetical protein TNIN_432301 [Trichonephila inaurata madagascariensis]